MDFTPITTQEEFDKAIQKRLAQKEREMTESFKEYMSPDDVKALKTECDRKVKEAQDCVKVAEDKLKEKEHAVSEITKRAEAAELSLQKNKIAYEHKLPLELAGRLVGTTEDELNKDAESLAALVKPSFAPPLRSTETNNNNNGSLSTDQALLGLLGQIKGNIN